MRRSILLSAVLLISAAGACKDAPSSTLGPPDRLRLDLLETDTSPLGPQILTNVLSGTLTAYVSSSSLDPAQGPYRYRWWVRQCPGAVDPIDCPYNYVLDNDTGSTMTRTVTTFSTGTKIDVIGQVQQNWTGGRSGADTVVKYVPPPSGNMSRLVGTSCDPGTTIDDYPWQEYKYNTQTQQMEITNRRYRRNACSGVKEFYTIVQ